MPDLEDLQEARKKVLGHVENHCPFKCADADLDEFGYCYHLMGFSNDRKTFEPIRPLIRLDKEGIPYDTGLKKVEGGKKTQSIEAGDVLVNPEFTQNVDGVLNKTTRWVSARVYRNLDKPPEREPLVSPGPVDDEHHQLEQRARELREKLVKKKLRDEIAAMEKELATGPEDEEDDSGDDSDGRTAPPTATLGK